MKVIRTKTIPNLPTPNQDVARKINLYGLNIDGYDECATIPYEIEYSKNGVDISSQFEKRGKPMQWRNSELTYLRDIETFDPIPNPDYEAAVIANQLPATIPNPDYVDAETTPGIPEQIPNPEYISDLQLSSIDEFLTTPAFDDLVNIYVNHPEIFWDFIDRKIDDDYDIGNFGTQKNAQNHNINNQGLIE